MSVADNSVFPHQGPDWKTVYSVHCDKTLDGGTRKQGDPRLLLGWRQNLLFSLLPRQMFENGAFVCVSNSLLCASVCFPEVLCPECVCVTLIHVDHQVSRITSRKSICACVCVCMFVSVHVFMYVWGCKGTWVQYVFLCCEQNTQTCQVLQG